MNHHAAQDGLAQEVKSKAANVHGYFWKLRGKHHNSLSRFLQVEEENLVSILKLCKVYVGANNNVSKNNLELLMTRCGCDYTLVKITGHEKADWFVRIGSGEASLPRDNYDEEGDLSEFPVEGKHFHKTRLTRQSNTIGLLVEAADKKPIESPSPKKSKKEIEVSPRQLLFDYLKGTMSEAGGSLSDRGKRKLRNLFNATIDSEARQLFLQYMEEIANAGGTTKEEAATPDHATSTTATVTPGSAAKPTNLAAQMEVEEDKAAAKESADEFLAELQDEIILQSLLSKRIKDKGERVFKVEHRNGKRLLVVVPPETQSTSTFLKEAKKTKWIDQLLDTDDRTEGMLTYVAKHNPDIYRKVSQKRGIKPVSLDTAKVLALGRVANLNDIRLKNARSFPRNIGDLSVEYSSAELSKIDAEVGLDRTQEDVEYNSLLYEWSSASESRERKPPEPINYWNASLKREIEAEIDLHLSHISHQNPEKHVVVPVIHYKGDGFDDLGITVLIGGDHGDKHCPVSAKLNLSSPEERKGRNDLSYQCPVVLFASIECSKDTYDILQKTIMPTIRKQLEELRQSAAVTVTIRNKGMSFHRTFLVHKTINPNTIAFTTTEDGKKHMQYAYGVQTNNLSFGTVELPAKVFQDIRTIDLYGIVTIASFRQLFIGDLAFLAMLLGMVGSAGYHCLMCDKKASEFNCSPKDCIPRTRTTIADCLTKYAEAMRSESRRKPANVKGINNAMLVDVNPRSIITPILHCPMGLVDKVLEHMKAWINFEVERFDDNSIEATRQEYKQRIQEHDTATWRHGEAHIMARTNQGDREARALERQMLQVKSQATRNKAEAKSKYDEAMSRHNARSNSLWQLFESVFRQHGIKKEHYHGGKYNGVNCIRIMEKGNELCDSFKQVATGKRAASMTEAILTSTFQDYAQLLAVLDAVWSNVRGIECGLRPTNQQVMLYEGLADKADGTIEKFHQVLKELRKRFRGITSHAKRESCIRRELRRQKSTRIQLVVDQFETKKKAPLNNKRKLVEERQAEEREAKRVRRAAAIARDPSF